MKALMVQVSRYRFYIIGGLIGFLLFFLFGARGGPQYAESVDSATRAATIIEYEHHEIHSGSSFHAEYSLTTGNTDADVTGILFKTPNTTKWSHMVITVSASVAAEAIINEAPTLADSGDGSDLAVFNRDRNSTKTSTLQSLEDAPTVGSLTKMNETEWTDIGVSAGTELEHLFLGGGSGPRAVGGSSRGTQEWVLDANTIYAVYLQNTGAPGVDGNTHYVGLDWYEHTNK
jgi:hypothetical protein